MGPSWTKKLPTEEGWYWARDTSCDNPVGEPIWVNHGGMKFDRVGSSCGGLLVSLRGHEFQKLEVPE